jgi:hypothetical protein
MSLTCGGRGPCCHVGYQHRHCEHCDTVIPVAAVPHIHGYPWYGPTYYGYGISGIYNGNLASQTNPFAGQLQNTFSQLALNLPVTEVPIDHAGE